jgi:hypothetical protein
MPQQRRFTAKFKTQIVLDLLTGTKPWPKSAVITTSRIRLSGAGKRIFSSVPRHCSVVMPIASSTSTALPSSRVWLGD